MAEKDAPEAGRRLHVTVLLVASRRALDNALSELGFAEDDDRVIEHDGRLAFLTCTHEEDCDDLFALITELSARGESWELQSRIDTEAGRAIYQSLARHRPVEAVDAAVDEEVEPDAGRGAGARCRNRRRAAGAEAAVAAGRAGRGLRHDPARAAKGAPPPASCAAARAACWPRRPHPTRRPCAACCARSCPTSCSTWR